MLEAVVNRGQIDMERKQNISETNRVSLEERRKNTAGFSEYIKPPLSENEANWKCIPNYDALIVVGLPGSGKTRLTKDLAKTHKGVRTLAVGEAVKADYEKRKNEQLIGARKRPAVEDRERDEEVMNLIKKSKEDGPIIIDARMGGWDALWAVQDMIEKNEEVPTVHVIYLGADEDVAAKRIYLREVAREKNRLRKEAEERGEVFDENTYSPSFTQDEVKSKTNERILSDIRAFKKAHPERLKGIKNPLHRYARAQDGNRVHHTVIDTTSISEEIAAQNANHSLERMGMIREYIPNEQPLEAGEIRIIDLEQGNHQITNGH